MLKSLITVGLASILITQPPQNTNDGTYYQDVNITESYEYETNEVNSVDDLVQGNIYKLDTNPDIAPNLQVQDESITIIGFYYLNNDLYYSDPNTYSNISINYEGANISGNNEVIFYINSFDVMYLYDGVYYFVFDSLDSQQLDCLPLISASDYLGEKTITIEPVETEGLYNLAYHFLYSRIYTNTELQAMETTLFGTTINMNMWLAHTTAIVIIALLLIVLIKFVIWLFKIVSGGMLWK